MLTLSRKYFYNIILNKIGWGFEESTLFTDLKKAKCITKASNIKKDRDLILF